MAQLVRIAGSVVMTAPLLVDALHAPAAPFRRHVCSVLAETGVHWRVLAALIEVRPSAMRRLLAGRQQRIHITLARAVMGASAADVRDARTTIVDAAPAREVLAALHQLVGAAGVARLLPEVDLPLRGIGISGLHAAQIQSAYDQVTTQSPEVRSGTVVALLAGLQVA